MTVTLRFATFYAHVLNLEAAEVEVPEPATVADAVSGFLADHPDLHNVLEERKLFLFGKLRAIYSISGLAVKDHHELKEGDILDILKAFIGG